MSGEIIERPQSQQRMYQTAIPDIDLGDFTKRLPALVSVEIKDLKCSDR